MLDSSRVSTHLCQFLSKKDLFHLLFIKKGKKTYLKKQINHIFRQELQDFIQKIHNSKSTKIKTLPQSKKSLKTFLFEIPRPVLCSPLWTKVTGLEKDKTVTSLSLNERYRYDFDFFKTEDDICLIINRSLSDDQLFLDQKQEETKNHYLQFHENHDINLFDFSNMNSILKRQQKLLSTQPSLEGKKTLLRHPL